MGQESWEDFFGKDDSKEVLIQKAIKLSSILVNTTADDINYLFDKAEDFNLELKGERLEAFFDLLILKIKLTDGFANLYLREELRGFFTNILVVSAGKMLVNSLEGLFSKKVSDGIERGAVSNFYHSCYENLKEYDKYTELSDILRHFNNKLAKRHTKNNDVKNISMFTKAIVETFSEVTPKLMNVSND